MVARMRPTHHDDKRQADTVSESDAARPTLIEDEAGATTLEWTLLVAAIALPGYFVMMFALDLLVAHYQMMTTLNALPFP